MNTDHIIIIIIIFFYRGIYMNTYSKQYKNEIQMINKMIKDYYNANYIIKSLPENSELRDKAKSIMQTLDDIIDKRVIYIDDIVPINRRKDELIISLEIYCNDKANDIKVLAIISDERLPRINFHVRTADDLSSDTRAIIDKCVTERLKSIPDTYTKFYNALKQLQTLLLLEL